MYNFPQSSSGEMRISLFKICGTLFISHCSEFPLINPFLLDQVLITATYYNKKQYEYYNYNKKSCLEDNTAYFGHNVVMGGGNPQPSRDGRILRLRNIYRFWCSCLPREIHLLVKLLIDFKISSLAEKYLTH